MQSVETVPLRRRHWVALCLSSLLAACGGGGSGDAQWDSSTASWDNMTWQ